MPAEDMKTVIALSHAYDDRLAQQLNALGHLAQAIGAEAAARQIFNGAAYADALGRPLGVLSWWPVIVLGGRASKIGEFWAALGQRDWPKACFTQTMITGGSAAQLEATAALQGPLPIVAVAAFGPASELNLLTKKLSLWRAPQLQVA